MNRGGKSVVAPRPHPTGHAILCLSDADVKALQGAAEDHNLICGDSDMGFNVKIVTWKSGKLFHAVQAFLNGIKGHYLFALERDKQFPYTKQLGGIIDGGHNHFSVARAPSGGPGDDNVNTGLTSDKNIATPDGIELENTVTIKQSRPFSSLHADSIHIGGVAVFTDVPPPNVPRLFQGSADLESSLMKRQLYNTSPIDAGSMTNEMTSSLFGSHSHPRGNPAYQDSPTFDSITPPLKKTTSPGYKDSPTFGTAPLPVNKRTSFCYQDSPTFGTVPLPVNKRTSFCYKDSPTFGST